MNKNVDRRNKWCFGLGTIGRDMFYTMVSTYMMVYITEVLMVSDATLGLITVVFMALRIFDAFNDPVMGLLVDNTRTRFGKFKPGMAIGAVIGGACMVMMFVDMGLTGAAYACVFGLCYLMWDLFFGLNDIAYWSMLPALSTDQKKREEMGAFARICANLGMFMVVILVIPATNALGAFTGSPKKGWFVFALLMALLMLLSQAITLFGVKENKGYFKEEEKTSLKEMFQVLFKNDQLLFLTIAMSLFMTGSSTTACFGVHYFKYVYQNEAAYPLFALVMGASQLTALGLFPRFAKRFKRRQLYMAATLIVVFSYLLFFFAPTEMLYVGLAGALLFVGQAFIQMLTLVLLADTIEYGQWKLGKRNESITFSVQPLINKIGGAVAGGILGLTLILSGVNGAATAAEVTKEGIVMMKAAMMLVPLVLISAGTVIYLKKFTIDEARYQGILGDLKARGDIKP